MPHELQTKLLRILEEKKLYRLGSEKPSSIDVRIVASTNKNVEKEVKDGNFREDLYYRLNAITIKIPPLRNRKEDIIPLTEHFLSKYEKELGVGTRTLSDESKETITSYSWPGNVRELENIIKRMLVLSSDTVISRETLLEAAPHLTGKVREDQETLANVIQDEISYVLDTKDAASSERVYETIIKKVEKPLIEQVLEITKGNKKKAASILGINRNTLSKKMEELGFQEKDKE